MNKTIKIAFFDTKPYDQESFDQVNKAYNFHITYLKSHLTRETSLLAQGFDAVCIFVNDVIDKDVVDVLKKSGVSLVALRASGYNNVDLKAIENKIPVVRVPAYSPHAVAEHAVMLMLALNRKVHRAYHRIRDNNFTLNGLMGFDMHGKSAGIIGTGQIGKIAIEILKGFGMRVLAYDIRPDKEYEKKTGFSYCGLDRLYHESDIISLHCPLLKETCHLIDERAIDQMKTGVMIINTGRGMLIDTKALIKGLKTGKIGFAGLDVYEEEGGYFFEDFSNKVITDDTLARLLSFNNVLITSHQGFFTQEAMFNIASVTLKNISDFFIEHKLSNQVCIV